MHCHQKTSVAYVEYNEKRGVMGVDSFYGTQLVILKYFLLIYVVLTFKNMTINAFELLYHLIQIIILTQVMKAK